jgi:hypothetical protein
MQIRSGVKRLGNALLTSLLASMLVTPALLAPALAASAERSGAFHGDAYLPFVGAPVKSIRFASLRGFAPIGRERLVLHTRAQEAWLLELAGPCFRLETAFDISVSSFGDRIFSGFDKLRVGRQECRIRQILSIDMQAFEQARKAAAPQTGI